MEKIVGKLVRDKIPEILQSEGKKPQVRRLRGNEFLDALQQKIVEEGQEVRDARSITEILEELADLQEVTDNILQIIGKTREDVNQVQQEKKIKRGGFERQIIIDRIE